MMMPLSRIVQALKADAKWYEVFGAGDQIDLQQQMLADASLQQLRPRLVTAARHLLAELKIAGAWTLHVAAEKLLRLLPNQGPQFPHFDTEGKEDATKRVSVIIYLTETISTYMPVFRLEEQLSLFNEDDDIDTESEQYQLASRLVKPENFVSMPVQSGDAAVLSTATIHFGPRNTTKETRYVLYFLFSPSTDLQQDEQQRLPLGQGVRIM